MHSAHISLLFSINLRLHLISDLNPSDGIISQFTDLIRNHLVASPPVITQVFPEQLPRVPQGVYGVSPSLAFYVVKSGHIGSFLYTLDIVMQPLDNNVGFCRPAMQLTQDHKPLILLVFFHTRLDAPGASPFGQRQT